jgi:hypothetical protein
MRFSTTWGVSEGETDGDVVLLEHVTGLTPEDVTALRDELGIDDLSVADGSVGKGASGPGAALVLEVIERAINDLGGLIGVGIALQQLIRRVSAKRGRAPATADPNALGALAAAYAQAELGEARYVHTVPVNVSEGVGTDERDVWTACFDAPAQGLVHVVFMSPSTLVLGHVRVPVEAYFEGGYFRTRTEEEIRAWWSS